MIKDNLRKVLDSIISCKEKYNLKQNVRLVAVSKYSDVGDIWEAIQAGQCEFGENKVQDLVRKYETFKDKKFLESSEDSIESKSEDSKHFKKIKWHFIGHLQENKINSLLNLNIELLHSLHSLNLANALQKRLAKQNKKIKALLQVNAANEDSKQGFSINESLEMYDRILSECPNIILNGMMCMGANTDNITIIDKSFNITKNLFDKIPNKSGDSILSMGMSNDYEIALKNGSNCLRLGSVIFK